MRSKSRLYTNVLLILSTLSASLVSFAGQARADAAAPGVTVVLQATSSRGLHRLAHSQGLGRLARLSAMRSFAPSASEQSVVAAVARDVGLHVDTSNVFSIHATGPSTALTEFQRRLQGSGLVANVIDDNRAGLLRPLASTINGVAAQALYDAPAGKAPSGSEPVVATVQLSGWDDSALSAYAVANGLPDPVASGQYTAVAVDGANPAVPGAGSGQDEVSLDQEALLAVGPYLGQRAYFAPNIGFGGLIDALNQIATDALDASHNFYNLAAVSISWGACEAKWQPDEVDALDSALANVLAAGVTVFAASGDDGGYGCGPSWGPAVNLPASDPSVVSVGGTRLVSAWPTAETPWYNPITGHGTGGGVSDLWYEPDYQKDTVTADGRVVPDIALDGDPATGFDVYADGQWQPTGGTSLASPLAAGTFTDLLASENFDYGIGDILPGLYAAPASDFRDITTGGNAVYSATSGFDAATGLGAPLWKHLADALTGFPTVDASAYSNSRLIHLRTEWPQGMHYSAWEKGAGAEPTSCASTPMSTAAPTSVLAANDGPINVWVSGDTDAGWCYTADTTVFVDTVRPTMSMTTRTGARYLQISWSTHDAKPSSGLTSAILRVSAHSRFIEDRHPIAQSQRIRIQPGTTYQVSLKVYDRAGNSFQITRRIDT